MAKANQSRKLPTCGCYTKRLKPCPAPATWMTPDGKSFMCNSHHNDLIKACPRFKTALRRIADSSA